MTVRKESLIGQIIACPRCSMMVQIVPPAGHATPPADAAPASGTPAPSMAESSGKKKAAAIAVAAPLFEGTDALGDLTPPPPPPTPAAEPILASTFDDAVDSLNEPLAATHATGAAPPAGRPTAPPEPSAATAKAEVGEVSRWSTMKLPAMIVGGALAGAALVGTLLALFSDNAQPPVAAAKGDVVASSAAQAPPQEAAPIAATEQPTVALKPAMPEPAAVAPQESGESQELASASSDADIVPPTTEAAEPLQVDQSAGTSAEPAAGADLPAVEPPVADEPAEAASAPRLRIDPLELDPKGLNLSTLYNGPPKDPLAASQLPGEAAGVDLSVPAPHEAPTDAVPAEPAPIAAGGVRRDERAGDANAPDVATLLARKLPELKIQNMPLCRLLDMAVQLGGVPVSVAPEQLRLAAVAAGQPATASVKDATIEEFLSAAVKPLRLQPVVVNDQIVLIRRSDNPRRSVSYDVGDLAANDEAVQRLADMIRTAVAPETWEAEGSIVVDGKQLKIDVIEATQYEILVLLERSRAALGLPPRSKYPAALVDADASPVALAERLGAPTTFTFSQYTPLREIFRHWQEEMQVAVLIDWPVLADFRLSPHTRIACSAAGKPWHAALDENLAPLGLAWRPVGKQTIEITSMEKASTAPLVEVYRLDPAAIADIENLTGELDQAAAASGATREGMTNVLLAEQALLIARQPATGQRAIAEYLVGKGLLAAK
jgi:hypothetical protein